MTNEDNGSFWGDSIFSERLETPVVFLRQAADEIEKKSRGLVVATVSSAGKPNEMRHDLVLRFPLLDNYSLLAARMHHAISFYPLDLMAGDNQFRQITNPDDLLRSLKAGLSDKAFQRKLVSIFSLIEVADHNEPEK